MWRCILQNVAAFQSEHGFYVQEMEIVIEKIKSMFDNPKSG